MKGGLNKIFRNVAATKGKSDFEKVTIWVWLLEDDQGDLPLRLEGAKGETCNL